MKAVLISIQPGWCKLIALAKKTVEIRKTKPKLETPFKCYIYCTKEKPTFTQSAFCEGISNGKVIGEFICSSIKSFSVPYPAYFASMGYCATRLLVDAQLTKSQAHRYLKEKTGYAWRISDLIIYDKPKELSEFYAEGDCDCMNCKNCAWFDSGNGYNVEDDCNLAYKGIESHKSFKPIKRPPQSWMYVEV